MKPNRWTRTAKTLLLSSLLFSFVYVGGSFLLSWILVRPGRRRDYDCIPNPRYGRLEPVGIRTEDGIGLHAWIMRSRRAHPDHWVLLLHGFRSDRCVVQNRIRFFARRGMNVLLLHFRGHGSSDRSRISYGYHERKDVKAAFAFLAAQNPGQPRVGINGISMGAAAAAYAVSLEGIQPSWMILESCYDNIRNALAHRLERRFGQTVAPMVAWTVEAIVEQMARLRAEDLDPAKALESSACPILLLAGDSEEVLKRVEIEYLYGCLPEPKQLVLFPGAGHQDLLAFDPKRYSRAAGGFLRTYADSSMVRAAASGHLQPSDAP